MGRWSEALMNPHIRGPFLALLVPAVCVAALGGLGAVALGINFWVGFVPPLAAGIALDLAAVLVYALAIKSLRIG